MAGPVRVTPDLSIAGDELRYTATRSSGPGGQHVNKANTRITLWFDVAGSPSLSDEQRALVLRRLATRIGRDGVLQVVSQRSRSREANREAALARFVELMRFALARRKPRTATRATRSSAVRRVETKKERGKIKRTRSKVTGEE
jgi:ribosome-associated protein